MANNELIANTLTNLLKIFLFRTPNLIYDVNLTTSFNYVFQTSIHCIDRNAIQETGLLEF